MKKLIEKRNDRFVRAVEEYVSWFYWRTWDSRSARRLLEVIPENEDPVQLLKSSAREHVPVNPATAKSKQDLVPISLQTIPDSKDRQTIDDIIEEIEASESYKDQITDRRIFEAKEGRVGESARRYPNWRLSQYGEGVLKVPLTRAIMNALESSRKITSFYTHQAAAIDAVREGKHVIVSTSTASGKSVIYQVCILFQAVTRH